MSTEHLESDAQTASDPKGLRYRALLTLTALGVVYGDIGTSPLYAMRECFAGAHGLALTEANVLGVLSLITWSLILVVSLKYLIFILRADNHGEGGILVLAALVNAGLEIAVTHEPGHMLVTDLDAASPDLRQWLAA